MCTGIGGGLSTTPGIVIVSQYFEKHRALANGITISGTAAGSFVFPMLIERLIHLFGFHGTLLILGKKSLLYANSSGFTITNPIILPSRWMYAARMRFRCSLPTG